jgi:hypothetical protein
MARPLPSGYILDGAIRELDLRPLAVYFRSEMVANLCRQFFAVFILFLCIGVMAREVPECMSLADDVSNDGDVAVYHLHPPQGVSSCTHAPDPGPTPAFVKGLLSLIPPSPLSPHGAAPVDHAGVGLLQWIDQLRC